MMVQASNNLLVLSLMLFIFFACWGSFLNVVGYRLLRDQSLIPRSRCPSCSHILPSYCLVPIFSWIFLGGRCYFCKKTISWLYPAIELVAAVSLTSLVYCVDSHYWLSYGLFFSAMLVTMRTDTEDMLILRATTLWMLPIGIIAAAAGFLPITLVESIMGALLGGGFLWGVRELFWMVRRVEGLGWGDVELLACIGAFTGPLGVFCTTMLASFLGTAAAILLIIVTPTGTDYRQLKLPFGTFLAAGAIVYVLFSATLTMLFFPQGLV